MGASLKLGNEKETVLTTGPFSSQSRSCIHSCTTLHWLKKGPLANHDGLLIHQHGNANESSTHAAAACPAATSTHSFHDVRAPHNKTQKHQLFQDASASIAARATAHPRSVGHRDQRRHHAIADQRDRRLRGHCTSRLLLFSGVERGSIAVAARRYAYAGRGDAH